MVELMKWACVGLVHSRCREGSFPFLLRTLVLAEHRSLGCSLTCNALRKGEQDEQGAAELPGLFKQGGLRFFGPISSIWMT